nr:hypothetical protein [Mesorhizobium sp. INR15]
MEQRQVKIPFRPRQLAGEQLGGGVVSLDRQTSSNVGAGFPDLSLGEQDSRKKMIESWIIRLKAKTVLAKQARLFVAASVEVRHDVPHLILEFRINHPRPACTPAYRESPHRAQPIFLAAE